jgi:hypothetical protein
LWQPPLANQREPRTSVRWTSLKNAFTKNNTDAAIGGTAPLLRFFPEGNCREGWQLDFFGVVLTRLGDFRTQEDSDFRFGLPLTWASGGWAGKLAYEHTSSHLGDDLIQQDPAIRKRGHVRDEVVAGLSYRWWDQLRLYGQVGYALGFSSVGPQNRDRYDVGLEWSKQGWTGPCGQPYAALDLEFRGEERYTPDLSAQVGWEWRRPDSVVSAFRLALEFYDGRSPFGQFFDRHEQWIGVGAHLDY